MSIFFDPQMWRYALESLIPGTTSSVEVQALAQSESGDVSAQLDEERTSSPTPPLRELAGRRAVAGALVASARPPLLARIFRSLYPERPGLRKANLAQLLPLAERRGRSHMASAEALVGRGEFAHAIEHLVDGANSFASLDREDLVLEATTQISFTISQWRARRVSYIHQQRMTPSVLNSEIETILGYCSELQGVHLDSAQLHEAIASVCDAAANNAGIKKLSVWEDDVIEFSLRAGDHWQHVPGRARLAAAAYQRAGNVSLRLAQESNEDPGTRRRWLDLALDAFSGEFGMYREFVYPEYFSSKGARACLEGALPGDFVDSMYHLALVEFELDDPSEALNLIAPLEVRLFPRPLDDMLSNSPQMSMSAWQRRVRLLELKTQVLEATQEDAAALGEYIRILQLLDYANNRFSHHFNRGFFEERVAELTGSDHHALAGVG